MSMTALPKLPDFPAHIPIRQEWLEQFREVILEPALPIVDAHHHLWHRQGQRYLFDEFAADALSGHNVVASVYVQCRSMYRADGPAELKPVGETEFVNGVAAQSASGYYGGLRACAGIVAFADLMLGDAVEPVLLAHLAAAPQRLRGIRNSTAADASGAVSPGFGKVEQHLLLDARFRRGFAKLAPLGLSCDVWAFHSQLHEVLDLARAFPQTSIVLDHAGGPLGVGPYAGRQAEVLAQWRAAMAELARLPNVTVKLGGLAMQISGLDFHRRPRPPSSIELAQAWKPWVENCVELFGTDRCMFESNFCVDKGMASYATVWNAFKRMASGASPDEKTQLFSGTAQRVYRLPQ